MIDKKTFWIGIMTVVAAVLLAAHSMQPTSLLPTAEAREVVDHRDYALATAQTVAGGEVVYILDKRTGMLGLLAWNNQTRRPEALDIRSLPMVFEGR